jgi:hypothetical protein
MVSRATAATSRGEEHQMGAISEEREIRAARNQALFRAVNEKMKDLNQAFTSLTESFTVACECADLTCLEIIEIAPSEYLALRGEPRQFVVRPGHIYPSVEKVVRETSGYAVVEKTAVAGEVAESLAQG